MCTLAFAQPEVPAPGRLLNFTAEEKNWIAAHPVIRVGHDVPYAPYAMTDQSGTLVGIDPDFLRLISQRTGLKFESISGVSWSQMLEDFKAGKVDALMNLSRTPEREAYMAFTNPYNSAPDVIVTRQDTPYLFDARELRGKRVAVVRGYAGMKRLVVAAAPGCEMVEYETPAAALTALAQGEVFAYMADVVNSAYLVRNLRLTNLRLGSVVPEPTTGTYIGVRKDWSILAGLIDKAVQDISLLEKRQTIDRWIGLDLADQWWLKAFKVAASIAAAAVLVFVGLFFHNRRLTVELTERRRIQVELEQTRDRLAQISEEKSEIMRMVAHDLCSPLTGIILGTEMWHTAPPKNPTELKNQSGDMHTAATQMMRLINELTAAQSLEEGVRAFTFGPHDAVLIMRDAQHTFASSAANKGIQIALQLPEHAVKVQTDGDALQQVVNNLVSNAVKFSPRNSQITLTCFITDNLCRMTVGDQGPGVAAGDQEKIFQKYGRGTARPTGGEKSTGLGLWIVRRTVECLHGRVWCEGQPGKGSVFIVELPVTPGTSRTNSELPGSPERC